MITSGQMKAARALVGLTQMDLANSSGVSIATIRRMEASPGLLGGTADNVWKIQRALESAGVIFVEEEGEPVGVKLRLPLAGSPAWRSACRSNPR